MTKKLLAGILVGLMLLTSCKGNPAGSSGSSDDAQSDSSEQTSAVSDSSQESGNGTNQTKSNGTSSTSHMVSSTFAKFTSKVNYTAEGKALTMEAYQDYDAYTSKRFEYEDMKYHWAEEGAIRLAQDGVFDKTKNFEPNKTITVTEFLTYLFKTASVQNADKEVIAKAQDAKLIMNGEFSQADQQITRQQMALILSRATEDETGLEQYRLLIDDYDSVDPTMKAAMVKVVGLGILDSGNSSPKETVNRAQMADALFKLKYPGMRNILPFDLGTAYKEGTTSYLVKNSMKTNPTGVQFGFWSVYNWQKVTCSSFGKRPIDRVDFHKWAAMETAKGSYTIGNFDNSILAHRAGSTIVTNIDISANLIWNPDFSKSNIPEFYPQDITDKTTRTAAKQFLYTYVQAMLNAVNGDILLSIDYEIDWQQNLMHTDEASKKRARIWADWYVEACEVARSAAKAMGASSRLKLIAIFNYATDMHKLGKDQNQWALDVAKASDYIGLDTYAADTKDSTDPSVTMESIRLFVNNYTEGKPFMVIENGFNDIKNEKPREGLLEGTTEQQNTYFKRLYRELNLEMSSSGFLQNQLRGFLNWCLRDTEEGSYGALDINGNEKEVAKTIRDGINRIERKRQYNPSVLSESTDVSSMSSIPVKVESGTQYEKLTYIVTNLGDSAAHTLKVKLTQRGSGLICVNGTNYNPKVSMLTKTLSFTIDKGLKKGVNYIDIYFGSDKTPFDQQVESVKFE